MPHHLTNSDRLCADLVLITTPQSAHIATLESINADSCNFIIDRPIPLDTPLTVSILECPQEKQHCSNCELLGSIHNRKNLTSLCYELQLVLESPDSDAVLWRPHHLTALYPTPALKFDSEMLPEKKISGPINK